MYKQYIWLFEVTKGIPFILMKLDLNTINYTKK